MSSGRKHMDDVLKNLFGGHGTPMDSTGWESFQKAYEASQKKKRKKRLIILFTAITLATTVFLFTIQGGDQQSAMQTKNVNATAADTNRQTHVTDVTNDIQKKDLNDYSIDKRSSLPETDRSANTNRKIRSTGTTTPDNTGQAATVADYVTAGNPVPETSSVAQTGEMLLPSFVLNFKKLAPVVPDPMRDSVLAVPLLPFESKKLIKQLAGPLPKWQLSFTVMTASTHNNYYVAPENNQKVHNDFLNVMDQNARNKTTINAGFGFKYNPGRVSVASGVEYTNMGQSGTYHYKVNKVPVFDIDGHIAGYIQLNDTSAHVISRPAKTSYSYVQLPVSVSYTLPVSKWFSLRIMTGGNLQYNIGKKGVVPDARYLSADSTATNVNAVNGSMMFGLGMDIPLSGRFSLGIDTRYAVQLRPLYHSDNLYNNKMSSMGLALSINYSLLRKKVKL